MISGLFLVNQKGEVIIGRYYRDDVSKTTVDAWRNATVAAKETASQPPVSMVDGASFMYTRHANMFFMATTRQESSGGENEGECAREGEGARERALLPQKKNKLEFQKSKDGASIIMVNEA